MSTWQTVEETGSSTREGEGAGKGAPTWSQGLKRLMSVREHKARTKQRVNTASETTLGGVQVVLRRNPEYNAVQSA